MKKCIFVLLCVMGTMRAGQEPVTVDVHCGDVEVCRVDLAPGQSVEIERLWSEDAGVAVHSGGLLSRFGTSLVRTLADSPFFTAITVWSLLFIPDSIKRHPYISMVIGGVLVSDFSLHMLHSADQKIHVNK